MRDPGNFRRALERAKKVRRLHHDRRHIILEQRIQLLEIYLAGRRVRHFIQLHTLVLNVSLNNLAILRVKRPCPDHAAASRQAERHQHGLICRRGAVIERRVCHLHSRQLRDQGLKLEHCL